MDVDQTVLVAVDAIGVRHALKERDLDAAVVDRVRRMPMVTDSRRRGRRAIATCDHDESDSEHDHGEHRHREAQLAAFGRTS